MIFRLIVFGVISALLMISAFAESFAIVGGKIWTGSQTGTIDNGTVIVVDGVIQYVGSSRNARIGNVTQIDANGKWVTPGIIASFSRVGLVEVSAEDSTNDTNAGYTQFSVALDASHGFNPAASSVAVTRIEGVTQIAVAPSPSNNIFAGQGFIANTSGGSSSIEIPKAFSFVHLDERGTSLAGGSRSSLWTYFTTAMKEAERAPTMRFDSNKYDCYTDPYHVERLTISCIDAEELRRGRENKQLLLISASRASDIKKIIEHFTDSQQNIAIVGAEEGWLVADQLAAASIPVIIDPFSNLPERFEQLGASQHNAERLIAAGVRTAFAHLGSNSHQSRLVLQSAGNAVANGVSHDDALRAITVVPAEIFGMNNAGSLERGKIADIVIWDGDPLEVSSSPDAVIIKGEITSLETRQTKLRNRYLDLKDDDTPFAYRK